MTESGPVLQGHMQAKYCARCGRVMTYRKRWANSWDAVKYCSKICRSRRLRAADLALEAAAVALLRARPGRSDISPSEVAQRVGGEEWQSRLEESRMAARRLANRGIVEITQHNQTVDISTARGPIRLRRGPQFPTEKP